MGETTAIEWTDSTWNPVQGCTKVNDGCTHCYAERLALGRHRRFYPNGFGEVLTRPDRLYIPSSWKRGRRIFVCAQSDLFHPRVPWDFIGQVFNAMEAAPQHTYQILTKRPGRMVHAATLLYNKSWIQWPSNVWAGVSIPNARYLPWLDVLARVPAKRFVSLEPLLGEVDIMPWLSIGIEWDGDLAHEAKEVRPRRLDHVIVGGESGPNRRLFEISWLARIVRDCRVAGVPCFVKQDSALRAGTQGRIPDHLWAVKELP